MLPVRGRVQHVVRDGWGAATPVGEPSPQMTRCWSGGRSLTRRSKSRRGGGPGHGMLALSAQATGEDVMASGCYVHSDRRNANHTDRGLWGATKPSTLIRRFRPCFPVQARPL